MAISDAQFQQLVESVNAFRQEVKSDIAELRNYLDRTMDNKLVEKQNFLDERHKNSENNFKRIEKDIEDIEKRVANEHVRINAIQKKMAYWSGAIMLGVAVLGMFWEFIVPKLFP